MRYRTTACIMLLALSGLATQVSAQTPGVQLIVTPPTISFARITGNIPVASTPPFSVQVVVPGQRPWRLMVTAVGPLQSGGGAQIPVQQVSWQAGPSPAFTNGTLSTGQPQLVGMGQGSRVGVLRFFFKNRWGYDEGNYSLRLHFTLISP